MNPLSSDFDPAQSIANDPQGHNLRATKDALEDIKSALRKQIDKGLANEDFRLADNLHKACCKGQELVEQFWSKPAK